MSLLLITWYSALATLVSLGLVAFVLQHIGKRSAESAVDSFREFFAEELYRLSRRFLYVVAHVFLALRTPLYSFFASLRKGKEYFSKRIFGRIEIEHGRASSFFLKHIAEHQEFLRRRTRERRRYEESI